MTKKDKENYIKNHPYSKYKNLEKPLFSTIPKSTNTKTTLSYAIPSDKYIFVFYINLSSITSFVEYIKKSVDYIIVIVDKNGNYIYNTSSYPYFKDNFFTTEYYKKIVQVNDPLEYEEFYNEAQGEDNFVVYYQSKNTGWTILTIEDSDSLDDKVLSIIPYILLLLPLLLIVIFIISNKFTKKIVMPLEILISKMEGLSRTSTTQKIELKNLEYYLFIRIIDSFNTMQDKIFQREKELKKSNELLIGKTKEISALNNSLQERIEEEIEKNRLKDQQMLQQSRLAQIGEMISMIAHQWRQPLAAISSTSMALSFKANLNKLDNETIIDLSTKISNYSQHLSSTINDFRDFFKPNKEKKETTYDELIESVLKIIEISLTNKNITLIQNLHSEKVFNTYPNELKQVILNLIKNAEDAILEREIENPTIIIESVDNILTIQDNAGGIQEDIIDKIFDPFFSTKKKKDGTGLGLYMSKTIVEKHCEGKLIVKNNKNGACFSIILEG